MSPVLTTVDFIALIWFFGTWIALFTDFDDLDLEIFAIALGGASGRGKQRPITERPAQCFTHDYLVRAVAQVYPQRGGPAKAHHECWYAARAKVQRTIRQGVCARN